MAKPIEKPITPVRAASQDDVRDLIELCRAGRLFEVQEWIANGRPVNGPLPTRSQRRRSPLEVAVHRGFHSLVKVLLDAGAIDERKGTDALIYEALRQRRFDLAELFVATGFDPATIDMTEVLATWEPAIAHYFIERGASLERGLPLARALCSKVRTALKIYKTYREKVPALQEQANIALRFHCLEGNLKWISLLLWAGADPYAPGVPEADEYDPNNPDVEPLSALGFAALSGRTEILSLKRIRSNPTHPEVRQFLPHLYDDSGIVLLQTLLRGGLNPNDSDEQGCYAIQYHVCQLGGAFFHDPWEPTSGKVDGDRDRARMKAIHLLAMNGGKWRPQNTSDVTSARNRLLKVKPEYTAEFVWLMEKYDAASFDTIQKLLSTPAMKQHVSRSNEVGKIIVEWRRRAESQPS